MSKNPNKSLFETLEEQDHLTISNDYKTTTELKKIRLYYTFNDNLELNVFLLTKGGAHKLKDVHTSKRDTRYINHLGANYTLSSILENIFNDAPLEKGIDRKFSPRERRVAKVSWFTKIIWFFRGGK